MSQSEHIVYKGITVEVIRSARRKTMALQVSRGKACIRLPAKLPRHHAESFISQKHHWLTQKLAELPAQTVRQFTDGEQITLLAQPLSLRFIQSGQNKVVQHNATLTIYGRQITTGARRRAQLQKWLRQQAENYCQQRIEQLSQLTQLYPRSVKVRSYKARWGSCSIQGHISLNWKLIMAPPTVIDYVILHELCHLAQHNHSTQFWQLVARFMPEFKTQRLWLKQYGHQLEL